jgi:hypothetical protein
MDWKKTFNQGQWFIHCLIILLMLLTAGAVLYAYRLNHLQNTESERTTKINSLISSLRGQDTFAEISKHLLRAESEKGHDKMRLITQQIAQIEELLEVKASADLGKNLGIFRKLINKNSGLSDPADALKVLSQKVNALYESAVNRGYKNITFISQTMKGRLSGLSANNVGGSSQVALLKSDIKRITNLVVASSLAIDEKNNLTNRLESMGNELQLLENLSGQSKELRSLETQATLSLSAWLIEIEKKAGNAKSIQEKKQNQLIILLASIVAILLISSPALAYLFRWQKQKISAHIENEIKSVVEKGIMGDERFLLDQYSESTRDQIVKLLDELKIKLNLGTLLHEGMPFAGCMIDHNFKITWHNNLFLDQLYLSEEEVRSDAFNWDYVRDYLNLQEDPIYQAIVNKVAGIYPVKVKQDEFAIAQPYEMYVTPVTANRESRVMVFFYPLLSVKDAIKEQVELTQQVIHKFISNWSEGELNTDNLFQLEKGFSLQDLGELFSELKNVYVRIEAERAEFVSTIRSIERENKELSEIVNHHQNSDYQRRQLVKDEIRAATELRESFIVSMDKTEGLININKTVMQMNDELKGQAQRLQNTLLEANKKGKESMEILSQLEAVKVDYKKLKLELLEVKAKLITLNNGLFAQLPPLDENQQKLAIRYKDELARLDFNVTTLDKKLSQLDIHLGKLGMIHGHNSAEQSSFSFHTTQRDHEIREVIHDLKKSLSQEEENVLNQFKILHSLMRQDLKSTPAVVLNNENERMLS